MTKLFFLTSNQRDNLIEGAVEISLESMTLDDLMEFYTPSCTMVSDLIDFYADAMAEQLSELSDSDLVASVSLIDENLVTDLPE